MSSAARYFHTLRHLRPIQVAGRIKMRLPAPRPDLRAPPPRRRSVGVYASPVQPAPSMIERDLFRFLNVERRCASPADWRPAGVAKLWTYNLHYFDDLNAAGSESRQAWHVALLERWVGENPPAAGDGWEPYPVSRRIVNWVKWAARGHTLPAVNEASLAVQARWLTRRLEYHILGNHLLANAKALVYVGLYFEGDEAEQWYAQGMQIIEQQLGEQVLSDGGHFELSTMYHAAVLEDLLDLVNMLQAYGRSPAARWLSDIQRMRHWLAVMSHPDGDIAFFNDAAFGSAPTPDELAAYAARLGLPDVPVNRERVVVLEASGYVRALAGPAYLLCDCAPVGPDHLPGHAHADTLGCELSLAGRRVLVNSGTSRYGTDAERQRQRGTAAHNTVEVDEQNSSDVWGGFRVGRRARVRLHVAEVRSGAVVIEASHDGYRALPGRNDHRRRWTLEDQGLLVEDDIVGRFRSAQAHWHLHPQVQAHSRPQNVLGLTGIDGLLATVAFEGARDVEVRQGFWHPRFGVEVANQSIDVTFGGAALATRLSWTGDRATPE